ncbi:hypothetical protein ACP70R_050036 [Stipagrostis hirtigluma subsp. patula]
MEAGAIDLGLDREDEERELEEEEESTCSDQRRREEEGSHGRHGGQEQEQAVYCAVGKEGAKEWKANLQWVLANFPRTKRLVLAHLHRPPSRINMMGAWVPVNQLAELEVTAYRQLEEEKASKVLDDLLDICKKQKVNASKIVILSDDIAGGLVQLVDDHGVTELVMGAAADRAYNRKMRVPRSKKALTVQQKANPSCKIWFVCKGNLICTRDANEGLSRAEPSTASTSPMSRNSDNSRSRSSARVHSEPFSTQESTDPASPSADQTPVRHDDGLDRNIEDLNHRTANIAGSSASLSEIVEAEKEPAVVQSLQEIEENPQMPSPDGSEAGGMDGALYEKLRDALVEAENLKHEAYEETRRRQMAERDLAEASKLADEAESSYQRAAKQRKEVEEMLARERAEMERDRRELDAILEQIQKVNERSAKMELQIASSERVMSDLEARLSESYSMLDELRREHRREEPATATEFAEESEPQDGDQSVSFLRLGYSELDEATKNFDESVRIDGGGGGGRGRVYRGELRDMAVAVKVFDPEVAVDEARFTRAVEAISGVRHPNLVTLVGACPEARAVVYELVPGGSLEDQLGGEGGAPPLPWHARCGIAYRTCSALSFLHSTRPRATVHGDVRPANILLVDEQLSSCKLAGVGARGLVGQPGGGGMAVARAALAYAHPQYLATGELTPECDVYSLGVVLLRLVTGRSAFLARKAAQEVASGGKAWHEVVDASAGGWPAEQAREVALLGLKCCDVDRMPRCPGEVLEEARGVLEAAMSAAPSRSPSSLSDGDGAPSYFLCPILKEVMRDPQIAGDGFTYEAEAIREWLRSGRDTSPMTNLKLPTRELMPNHALLSAIREWEWRHRHARPPRAQLDRFH